MYVINICLVRLVWCAFNEVHLITRDRANCDFGNNCWNTGTIGINMCYILNDFYSGCGIERGMVVLPICIGCDTDNRLGKHRLQGLAQNVHFFYARSHLSKLQSCKSIISINFSFVSKLKYPMTQFSH